MQHVSIVSSKRMPEQLGDRDLFTGELTEVQQSTEINYNVACAVDGICSMSEVECYAH